MHPKMEGILESSLRFYEKIFGFRVISDFGERGCAMEAGTRQVLLLFIKSGSRTMQTPHYGDGELHVAFAIRAEELAAWEDWLAENGIAVEEKRVWELGGQSNLFPRSRSASDRDRDTGRLVDLLMRAYFCTARTCSQFSPALLGSCPVVQFGLHVIVLRPDTKRPWQCRIQTPSHSSMSMCIGLFIGNFFAR
jgi:catechol 2,3-dioxygenase-like lactoylglutathione lyase family enzyme